MDRIKLGLVLISSFCILSCSPPPKGWNIKEYCEQDAGSWIEKQVSIDGYMLENPSLFFINELAPLLESKLDFIELSINSPVYSPFVIKENGIYRISVQDSVSGNCTKSKSPSRIEDKIHPKCLLLDKVEEPLSKYAYVNRTFPLPLTGKKGVVNHSKYESYVYNLESKERISQYINYSYSEHSLIDIRARSCDKIGYKNKFMQNQVMDALIYE